MLSNPASIPIHTISLQHEASYIRLQEHHCFRPNEPLGRGEDAEGWGDGILNAWLPQGIDIQHEEVRFSLSKSVSPKMPIEL